MNTYNNSLRFYKTYYDNIDWGLDKKNAQTKESSRRKIQLLRRVS